jgi:hypothetical protein
MDKQSQHNTLSVVCACPCFPSKNTCVCVHVSTLTYIPSARMHQHELHYVDSVKKESYHEFHQEKEEEK